MTGSNFAAYIRKKTKTNSNTFTDADIVTFANVVKDDIAEQIVTQVGENYFDIEMVRDLEADERGYTFPNDILKHMKYITAKLDGTNEEYLEEAFISQIEKPLMENSEIKDHYASKDPEFLIKGRELFILSGDDIIDVTEGLKIVAEIYPEDITTSHLSGSTDLSVPSSNTTHRLPRATHKHWATGVIIEYKQSKEKPIPLTEQERAFAFDLEKTLEKLERRNAVRSFVATVPKDDGHDY